MCLQSAAVSFSLCLETEQHSQLALECLFSLKNSHVFLLFISYVVSILSSGGYRIWKPGRYLYFKLLIPFFSKHKIVLWQGIHLSLFFWPDGFGVACQGRCRVMVAHGLYCECPILWQFMSAWDKMSWAVPLCLCLSSSSCLLALSPLCHASISVVCLSLHFLSFIFISL